MPRIDNWDEFADKAKTTYDNDPVDFRLTMKYRHNDGKLDVKVTDNRKVHQYTAEQAKEVRNLDKLLSAMMRSMTS